MLPTTEAVLKEGKIAENAPARVLPTTEEILKAARIPENTPIDPREIVAAILRSNEVRDRVFDILVEELVVEALERVRDYPALHKNIGLPQPEPAPVKPKVRWGLEQGLYSGKWYVIGNRAGEVARFMAPTDKTEWYGEKIPENVLEAYERCPKNSAQLSEPAQPVWSHDKPLRVGNSVMVDVDG